MSDEIVANLRIEATETVPHGVAEMDRISLDDMRAMYAGQARGLAEAMFHTLPGGLIDAILVELMRRKVSVLAVAWVTEKQQ